MSFGDGATEPAIRPRSPAKAPSARILFGRSQVSNGSVPASVATLRRSGGPSGLQKDPLPMTRLLALLTSPGSRELPPWAQDPSASAKLYARSEGATLQVAIKVTPDFDCYFYDDGEAGDVGDADAGHPLRCRRRRVRSDVWFPEAHVKASEYEGLGPQSDLRDEDPALRGGQGAGDLDPSSLVAEINGQVCNQLSCVPWEVTLKSPGKGTDAVWGSFPAALLASASPEAPSKGEPQDSAGDGDAPEATSWAPIFGENEVAKARWFGRVDEDDVAEIVVEVATPEGWHMYGGPDEEDKGPGIATPTVVTVEGGGVEWEEVHHPRPEHYAERLLRRAVRLDPRGDLPLRRPGRRSRGIRARRGHGHDRRPVLRRERLHADRRAGRSVRGRGERRALRRRLRELDAARDPRAGRRGRDVRGGSSR